MMLMFTTTIFISSISSSLTCFFNECCSIEFNVENSHSWSENTKHRLFTVQPENDLLLAYLRTIFPYAHGLEFTNKDGETCAYVTEHGLAGKVLLELFQVCSSTTTVFNSSGIHKWRTKLSETVRHWSGIDFVKWTVFRIEWQNTRIEFILVRIGNMWQSSGR